MTVYQAENNRNETKFWLVVSAVATGVCALGLITNFISIVLVDQFISGTWFFLSFALIFFLSATTFSIRDSLNTRTIKGEVIEVIERVYRQHEQSRYYAKFADGREVNFDCEEKLSFSGGVTMTFSGIGTLLSVEQHSQP